MDDERLNEAYRELNDTLAPLLKEAEPYAAAYADFSKSIQASPAIQQMIAELQQAWEESGLTWDEFAKELSKPPTYSFPDYAAMFMKEFSTEYRPAEAGKPLDDGPRIGIRQTYH